MRAVLMASATMFLTAGMALAQITPTSPAPSGAPNAPAMAPAGASPGNAGSNAPAGGAMAPSAGGAMSSSGPAPTGAPEAARVTPPGASPGNMGTNTGAQAATGNAMTAPAASGEPAMKTASSMPVRHGMGGMGMSMPASGSPESYLHIAKMAIKHDNKAVADDALSHAETRLLDRAVPAGEIAADDTPAVTTIEHARSALGSGDMAAARTDTDMAMQQVRGMMGGISGPMGTSAMGGGMSGNTSGNMTAPKPDQDKLGASDATGGAPQADETSDSAAAGGAAAAGNRDPMKPASAP